MTNITFPIDITKYTETKVVLADVRNTIVKCHTVLIQQSDLNNLKDWVGGYYYKETDYCSFNLRTNINGIYDAIITANGVSINSYNVWIEVLCRK